MPDQKKQHTEQQKKCSGNTCDQKKNILAFTVGHRECATRKKSFRRSGAAIENARPEKKPRTAETNVYEKNRDQNKTCWRSGVALKTCATRKKNLFFSYGHRKCATTRKHHNEHRTNGRYPKKCATRKKKHSCVQGQPSNTPH